MPKNNGTSSELANLIKNTGAERIPRKKRKLRRLDMKSVSVGWKKLDKESGKYEHVRADKGGEARNVYFNPQTAGKGVNLTPRVVFRKMYHLEDEILFFCNF